MCKKWFLSVMILLLPVCVMAQTNKGDWVINPEITGFGLSSTENSDNSKRRFNLGIDLNGGKFIADNLAFMIGAGFEIDKQSNLKNNRLDLSAGLRYYVFSRLFVGAGLSYEKKWERSLDGQTKRSPNYFMFGADLGYAIFLTRNISLDPGVYWKYSFADKYNKYGIKIGFSIYL